MVNSQSKIHIGSVVVEAVVDMLGADFGWT